VLALADERTGRTSNPEARLGQAGRIDWRATWRATLAPSMRSIANAVNEKVAANTANPANPATLSDPLLTHDSAQTTRNADLQGLQAL
jgi:hypothetical protein